MKGRFSVSSLAPEVEAGGVRGVSRLYVIGGVRGVGYGIGSHVLTKKPGDIIRGGYTVGNSGDADGFVAIRIAQLSPSAVEGTLSTFKVPAGSAGVSVSASFLLGPTGGFTADLTLSLQEVDSSGKLVKGLDSHTFKVNVLAPAASLRVIGPPTIS